MLKRLYLFLPLLFSILLVWTFQSPQLIKLKIVYPGLILLSLLAGIFLIQGKFKKQWPFFVHLLVFVTSGLGFLLFLNDLIWQIIFILIFNLVLGIFLFHIYQLFNQPRISQPQALKKMSSWLNFIISYWFLFCWGHFLGPDFFISRLLIATLAVFVFILWLFYYDAFSRFSLVMLKDELLIKALIFAELFLVINFLPLGIYLTTLSLSLLYIIMVGSSQFYFNKLTKP